MGASGAAFGTAIDAATWDPLSAAPLDAGTLARAGRAAGVRTDTVAPPFDDEMRELVLDRTKDAIAAQLPPLVRGAVGPPEYGVIVGYDERTPTFFVRSYFDRTADPTEIGWDAFDGPDRGTIVFLDRASAPERSALAREGIESAVAGAGASDEALRAWRDALRDEGRWRDPAHGGSAAFADHAMRTILADKRRSAARFLRSVRDALPARAGAEVLRAAEAYGNAAAAAEHVGAGAFDPGIAARFVEGGHRRAWANALDRILEHEALAHDALGAARAAFGR
jgi:hypothetical protein